LDYQAQAIILKTYRLGEVDKILHLYSRQHGPLRVVAKSAYKIKSKIGAKAQVLNCLDLILATGRNLDIIKEASRIDNFAAINSNYSALSLSYLMVDILDHIAISDDQYQEPFDLLFNHLKQMNQISMGSDVDQEELMLAASARYLWRLIKILGYKPELDHCSLSHKKRATNQIPQYFDFANGSITSSMARSNSLEQNPYQDQIQEMRPGVFKVLHYFNLLDTYNQDLNAQTILMQLNSMNDRSRSLNNSLAFLQKHLSFMIHKEFKSWKLVDELLNPQLAEVA
jgi:DNA repair protein RecO (recombination protein O)